LKPCELPLPADANWNSRPNSGIRRKEFVAVAPVRLELQRHLAHGVGFHALVDQSRAGDVAAKLFQRLPVGAPRVIEVRLPRPCTVSSFINRVEKPEPSVRLTDFAADGLELTIYFWIGDPEEGTVNACPTSISPCCARSTRWVS
jgi:hypothetical protein